MVSLSASAVRGLPKAELHSHIDGSVPLGELFRIARRHGRKVTTQKGDEIDSVSSFVRHVTGPGYGSLLDNIVERFYPITNVMQTQEILRDVGRSYAAALKRDNVLYAEGRFAPQYHTGEGLAMGEVISSMAEGLAEGSESHGVKVGLIVAIGRESKPEFGTEVAKAAVLSGSAVALDLGGPEVGNPPAKFRNAFRVAREAGLKLTVHAGEGAGSVKENLENIREAITSLGAQRVGHAVDLAKDESLVDLVLERSVSVEMNPVSNLVLGKIGSLRELQIDRLLAKSVPISLNSDDPALWQRGRLPDVFASVCREYRFGRREVDALVENSIRGAFAADRVKEEFLAEYRSAWERMG